MDMITNVVVFFYNLYYSIWKIFRMGRSESESNVRVFFSCSLQQICESSPRLFSKFEHFRKAWSINVGRVYLSRCVVIAIHILPQKSDLSDSFFLKRSDLIKNSIKIAATLPTPNKGNNTV